MSWDNGICRRCSKEPVVLGLRTCEHCSTHKQCSRCKLDIHKSEFEDGRARCKKCDDIVENYLICRSCGTLTHRKDFIQHKCLECRKKIEDKYFYRECSRCGEKKHKDEFEYGAQKCKACGGIRRDLKIDGIKKCKCGEKFNSNEEFCPHCNRKNLKSIKKKNRKSERIIYQNRVIYESGKKFPIICDKCKNEIILLRKRKSIKKFICQDCKEKIKNSVEGELIRCKFCGEVKELITKEHIFKCSNGKLNLEDYIRIYGNDRCSEKYKNRLILARRLHLKTKKISTSSKLEEKFYENLKNHIECKHSYIFDFYEIDIAIPDKKIAIEIDGDYWHGNPNFYPKLSVRQLRRQSSDKKKDKFLKKHGWSVLRFWETDIKNNTSSCIEKIKSVVNNV